MSEECPYCNEKTCPGKKDNGGSCLYKPGQDFGTDAIDPIGALIEAAEELLSNICDADDDSDDEGRLFPDIRRLNAAIAWAKSLSSSSSRKDE